LEQTTTIESNLFLPWKIAT